MVFFISKRDQTYLQQAFKERVEKGASPWVLGKKPYNVSYRRYQEIEVRVPLP
jgi:hypothetical protein